MYSFYNALKQPVINHSMDRRLKNLDDYSMDKYLNKALVHDASVAFHSLSFGQTLLSLPTNSKPSSHVNWQISPRLSSPSSPSEQFIVPLSGVSSGGHVTKRTNIIIVHCILNCRCCA